MKRLSHPLVMAAASSYLRHSSSRLYSKYAFYDLAKRQGPKRPVPVSALSADEKIALVFGGRIKGEDRKLTSRIYRGEPRNIAGIMVPCKPAEPENCCMSGCINCVWELFNEDVQDWNTKRAQAAQRLKEVGGRWPENFDAPVSMLAPENLPLLQSRDIEHSPEQEDAWSQVPEGIKVFASVEAKIKARQKRLLELIA